MQKTRPQATRSFKRSGSVIAASSFVAAGVAFLANLLMARALGPGSRGDVAFLLQISYFLAPIATLGRERQILRDGSQRPALATGGYVLIVCGVAALALSPWLGVDSAIVGAISLCGAMLSLLRAEAISSGKISTFLKLFAMQQTIILLATIVLFILGVKDWRIWAIAYAASAGVYMRTEIRSMVRRDRLAFSRTSLGLMPGALAALAVTRLDRIVLPLVSGPYELGLYVTVATATEPVLWIAQVVADRRSSVHRVRRDAVAMDVAAFATASAAMGVLLWFLVVPLFGEPFAAAKPLILPLSVAGFLLAMFRQSIGALISSSRPMLATRAEILSAAVAAGAYVVAIPPFGALGAAWASAFAYASSSVLAYWLKTTVARQKCLGDATP